MSKKEKNKKKINKFMSVSWKLIPVLYVVILVLSGIMSGRYKIPGINDIDTSKKPVVTDQIVAEQRKENPIAAEQGEQNIDLTELLNGVQNFQIPEIIDDSPYIVVNNNKPYFNGVTAEVFEMYDELDSMGRCQVACANICKELMPTTEREGIGMIKPTGWHIYKYDFVDGKYLYNRCHLIGYQLTGENANEKNLITGTRYLNVEGMLPFENKIAEYVKRTDNHVMYRVSPIFEGDNLLATGVLMEAKSVEYEELEFCVFCPNIQPGVKIDYKTGEVK